MVKCLYSLANGGKLYTAHFITKIVDALEKGDCEDDYG